jgi:hypothetical protein
MKTLLIFTLTLFLNSCGIKNTSQVTQKKDIEKADNKLLGMWKTICENSSTTSYYLEIVFSSNGKIEYTENYFSGLNCLGSLKVDMWKSFFNFTNGTTDITFSRTKMEMTAQSVSDVNDYNSYPMCNITDWTLNIARNVTDLDCDSVENKTESFNVTYVINGNSIDFLGYSELENENFYKSQ